MAKRYTHNISDAEIEKLKKKLDLATFPDEVKDGGEWQFGVPLAKMRQLVKYWKDSFDIKEAFSKLNELPQYTAPVLLNGIGEVNIHFVHQVNTNPASIPLLFCHGCTFMPLPPLVNFANMQLSRARLFYRSF